MSPSAAEKAPPVAVEATKSSLPPTWRTACLEARTRLRRRCTTVFPPQPDGEQGDQSQAAADRPEPRLSLDSTSVTTSQDRLADYARLVVRVGLNLQPGQVLGVNALPRACAARARGRAGGLPRRRDSSSTSSTPTSTCGVPTSSGARRGRSRLVAPLARQAAGRPRRDGGALLGISGNPEPELFADLDGEPRRAGADARGRGGEPRSPTGSCNWAIVACPNEGWATTVFGEPDVERLWDAVASAVRLDETGPGRRHGMRTSTTSSGARTTLNARRFDALRYRGPGTDLTVGLHPDSTWIAARDEIRGIEYVPNMPTEEVFTRPDARRVDGTVRATYPLQIQGTIVRGLEVRFENGRAVEVHADEGEELMRTHVATDDGAARLGEVALVDADSRVGRTGIVFYDTLFDENAASHIALGHGDRPGASTARSALVARRAPCARHQPVVDPHRLHDRLERARRLRRRQRRQRVADPAERRLGPD